MTVTTPAEAFSDARLNDLASKVGQQLLATGRVLVTAESCTGGWIGKAMTDIAGSSAWFAGGAVVYSNGLKQRMLGVQAATLAKYGAVSEATVREMSEGALLALGGDIAVAVSGVAGPAGGTASKPVGTVWFAWARRTAVSQDTPARAGTVATIAEHRLFSGDREAVRRQTVAHAFEQLLERFLEQ